MSQGFQLSRLQAAFRKFYGRYNVEIGLTAGVTGQQGMLTPPWHLIPSLIYSEVRVRPFSDLYFLLDLRD
jgi:hypothetical protein